MLNLSIVILYFAVIVAIGTYVYRKRRASRSVSFFVADRQGTPLLIFGSLCSTIIGGSATVGLAGWGFKWGIAGAWWLLVGSVGLLVLFLFFAGSVRRFGLYTLPELVGKQYGGRAGLVASLLIVVAWVGIIAAQIVAAGKILSVLIDQPLSLLMFVCAFVFILYTVVGGQHSIIRTDLLQFSLLVVGIFVCFLYVLSDVGGFSGFASALPSDYFCFPVSSQFGWWDLLSCLVLVGATYVVGPDIYSRLFCAENEKVARFSALSAGLAIIPITFFVIFIGMGAKVLFPDISSEQSFPTIIENALPVGVSGLVIAALLAAIMSSADTCLLTTSTILTEDIYKQFRLQTGERETLLVSRLGIVLIGIIALMIALRLGGVISSLLLAYTIFTSGIVIPVIIGFYRDKLKVNSSGALAAIIGGGATGLVIKLLKIEPPFDLLGMGVCILLLFGVSGIIRVWASHRGKP